MLYRPVVFKMALNVLVGMKLAILSQVRVVRNYGDRGDAHTAFTPHHAEDASLLLVNITNGEPGCAPAVKSGSEVVFRYTGRIGEGRAHPQ